MPFFLIQLIVALVIFGTVMFVVRLLPVDPNSKSIILAIVACFFIVWLLYFLMGFGPVYWHYPAR